MSAKKPKPHIAMLVTGLESKNKRIRNGCAELCSLLSAAYPELLYPYIDIFANLLQSKEPVMRWEAACTIGNLASSDSKKRVPLLIPVLTKLLRDKSIVLQGHAVKALAKVAVAYPKESGAIVDDLLKAAHQFPGNRIGYLIDAMEFFKHASTRKKVMKFIIPLADSEIAAVAKKARRILKLLSPEHDSTKKTIAKLPRRQRIA